jgi:hypothetical protein
MKSVLRFLGGLAAGIVTAFVLLIAVELFSNVVHPFPEGFQGTQEEICAHVERYPAWVLAVAVPMWVATAFISTWVAGKLGRLAAGLTLGSLLVVALVCNLAMLPYPLWFKAACLLLMPVAVAAATFLISRHRLVVAAEAS